MADCFVSILGCRFAATEGTPVNFRTAHNKSRPEVDNMRRCPKKKEKKGFPSSAELLVDHLSAPKDTPYSSY